MKIDPVPLFASRKEVAFFLLGIVLLFLFSLGNEYRQYLGLKRYDDAVIEATVVRQYAKTNATRTYEVLKLRSKAGAVFYMAAPTTLRDLCGYTVKVWLRTQRISFLDYLRGFYAHGAVDFVLPGRTASYRVGDAIAAQHADPQIGALFAALFAATPIPKELRQRVTALGIGHLLAISGFHIGLLSALLFWLLRYPYRAVQSRWFPWRNSRRDIFFLTAAVMLGYVWFLQIPPSVLRAYTMLLIGFFFYDRGIRLVSFQSLAITVGLLAALWPRLLFSFGFWLSVAGVFYVFAFLYRFESRGKVFKFFGLHFWVYLMMLPFSLVLFKTFSTLHPLSVIWTILFIPFYPLELFLHVVGQGGLFDGMVKVLLRLGDASVHVEPYMPLLAVWVGLSLLTLKSETVKRLLPYLAAAVFIGAVYQVA
jgi:competence protein ComEC